MNEALSSLLSEIKAGVEAGFYLMPVILAATLPDVCAALEANDGRTSQQRYKEWYDAWASDILTNFTAEDCYSFRCGVVHQGRLGDMQSSYNRAIFPLPTAQQNTFMNCVINDAYFCGVEQFCESMITAASRWYEAKGSEQNVVDNLTRMMRIYPTGLTPYAVGMPLLA